MFKTTPRKDAAKVDEQMAMWVFSEDPEEIIFAVEHLAEMLIFEHGAIEFESLLDD